MNANPGERGRSLSLGLRRASAPMLNQARGGDPFRLGSEGLRPLSASVRREDGLPPLGRSDRPLNASDPRKERTEYAKGRAPGTRILTPTTRRIVGY